ncbi:hypothetical protein IWX90DRAFT_473981 [Phyllosticta citrichinensis]|uniref:Uncharacterized protein n=1 Tax=Phyllosticta citrichinensis TaxID=1130410 RepID=A0ABR1Y5N7_9PEZI
MRPSSPRQGSKSQPAASKGISMLQLLLLASCFLSITHHYCHPGAGSLRQQPQPQPQPPSTACCSHHLNSAQLATMSAPDPPDRPTDMKNPKRCRLCDDFDPDGTTHNDLLAHFAERHPLHEVFRCPREGCTMSTNIWSSLSRHYWRAKGHAKTPEQQKKVDEERKRDTRRGGRKKKKEDRKRRAQAENEDGDNGEREHHEREDHGATLMRDFEQEIAAFKLAQATRDEAQPQQSVQQSPQQQQVQHKHQHPPPQFSQFPLQHSPPPFNPLLQQPQQYNIAQDLQDQQRIHQQQHQNQFELHLHQFQIEQDPEPAHEPQHADNFLSRPQSGLSQQHPYNMYPKFQQQHHYIPPEVEQQHSTAFLLWPQSGTPQQQPYYQHLQYPQYPQQHQYYHSEVEQHVQPQLETQYFREQRHDEHQQVQQQYQYDQPEVEQDVEPQHDEHRQL